MSTWSSSSLQQTPSGSFYTSTGAHGTGAHGTGTPGSGGGGMSKWAKGWAKTFSDGAHTITEKWQNKKTLIDDDPLVVQRQEINEYQAICASIQRMLLSLSALLDSVMGQQKAADDLNRSVLIAELASSQDLQKTTETHLEGWATICRHHDSTKGRLQTLRLEVKNHLTFIQQTQREFEQRDRKFRRMQEEMKRLQKQRFTSKPDPAALDRQTVRTEKATTDFRDSTTSLADRSHHILEGRQRYLQESTKNLFDLQSEFFGKLALAMNEANPNCAGSPGAAAVYGGHIGGGALSPSAFPQSYSGLHVRSASTKITHAPQYASRSAAGSSNPPPPPVASRSSYSASAIPLGFDDGLYDDSSSSAAPVRAQSHHRARSSGQRRTGQHHAHAGGSSTTDDTNGSPFAAAGGAGHSGGAEHTGWGQPSLLDDMGAVGLVLGSTDSAGKKVDRGGVMAQGSSDNKFNSSSVLDSSLPPPPSSSSTVPRVRTSSNTAVYSTNSLSHQQRGGRGNPFPPQIMLDCDEGYSAVDGGAAVRAQYMHPAAHIGGGSSGGVGSSAAVSGGTAKHRQNMHEVQMDDHDSSRSYSGDSDSFAALAQNIDLL